MAGLFSGSVVGVAANTGALGDWWQTLTLGGFVGLVLLFVVVKWMPAQQKAPRGVHQDDAECS